MYNKTHKNNKDESQYLKDLAPNFSKIEKKNPFMVPNDYFEKLPSIIQQRCNEKTLWEKRFSFILRPQYYVSVSLAVIVIIFILISYNKSNTQKILIANNNNIEYYAKFLTEQDILEIGDFDEETLIEILLNETNSNKKISYISEYADYKDISADDIINYLSDEEDNNIDDMINELRVTSYELRIMNYEL